MDLLDGTAPPEAADRLPKRKVNAIAPPPLVATTSLFEDPGNPRTEFSEVELDELAEDVRQHGILQPIVVHPADADGRYRIHFGSKRWRAALRLGLQDVPVVIRDAAADPYTQVAENQKRRGLTPLDLARFIRGRVEAGDSNATVGKRLGMNLTTVAHHLALLELPPALEQALKSGRCTSPRTLHELSKLHESDPAEVDALVRGDTEITRATVSAVRSSPGKARPTERVSLPPDKLIALACVACDRLEQALSRIAPPDASLIAAPELVALRSRLEGITQRWLKGSDRQTPSQAER